MPILTLHGCSPEPLGNYLKALGVFRLVAEQADPAARAWWEAGAFRLSTAKFVNVLTKEGMKKVTLRTVLETPDNRHYARQNILTRGAVVDTEIGKVKITNRVGQDGVVNGKLL